MAILVVLSLLAILALLAGAALRWGVDSRVESVDDRGPRQPVGLDLR
jgi:nitrogen fixation-related uncharacterized protein